MAFCDPHPEDGFVSGTMRTWFCGVSELAGATVGEAGETVRGIAGEVGETVQTAANPYNAAAVGAGLTAGLTVPIVVVGGTAGLFAIDFFANDGRATAAVVRGVTKLLAALV